METTKEDIQKYFPINKIFNIPFTKDDIYGERREFEIADTF